MLEPDSRSLLSELLRPPAGFRLSHAVGTSFTMTLEAALAIPLAFARSVETDDRVGILGAVRRATQRIDLFAQAGCLGLGAASDLVAVLEPMIHSVRMPPGRLFHPKVWFLEFESDGELRYRFICSSRNLTNDRTWDAVIALDGSPGENLHERDAASNEAMASMLTWLIRDDRASPKLNPARARRIARLAESWRGIRWEHPDRVRKLRVHCLGVGAPNQESPRLLQKPGLKAAIISPFVSDQGIAQLRARPGRETSLISRPESLDALGETTLDGLALRVLDDMVDLALEDAETGTRSRDELRGLHAKVVVHDHAHEQSSMLVGSANATDAAWSRNVEVMVEVEGPTRHFGVDAVVSALTPMIDAYETDGDVEPTDAEQAALALDTALRDLARARLFVRVHSPQPHSVSLWASDVPPIDERFTISWRMLSLPDPVLTPLPTTDVPYLSGPLALEQITPFIMVALRDPEGRRRETVVVAEVLDDVAERGDAIIAAHLTGPDAVSRFIRLMLQDVGTVLDGPGGGGGAFGSAFGRGVAESGSGLLELLVRASATNRDGLAEVKGVLDQLAGDPSLDALPAGFADVWDAVVSAAGSRVAS
ncbi:phospholipase D family protein [Microbacterium sp. 179-I 3D2 NHS]|uniref:phospholipase D family protein n=1 Tax=Microbacterium sp. 179-I 3D2 NHS TaxID=3235178 RepID=UPI00399F7BEC